MNTTGMPPSTLAWAPKHTPLEKSRPQPGWVCWVVLCSPPKWLVRKTRRHFASPAENGQGCATCACLSSPPNTFESESATRLFRLVLVKVVRGLRRKPPGPHHRRRNRLPVAQVASSRWGGNRPFFPTKQHENHSTAPVTENARCLAHCPKDKLSLEIVEPFKSYLEENVFFAPLEARFGSARLPSNHLVLK